MGKNRYNSHSKTKRKTTRDDDARWRLTYLHTASTLLSRTSPKLSRFYTQTGRQICRRINMLTDSVTIKRTYCKQCNSSLLPCNARHRVESKKDKYLMVTCAQCGTKRRLPLYRKKVEKAVIEETNEKKQKLDTNGNEKKNERKTEDGRKSNVHIEAATEVVPKHASCAVQ